MTYALPLSIRILTAALCLLPLTSCQSPIQHVDGMTFKLASPFNINKQKDKLVLYCQKVEQYEKSGGKDFYHLAKEGNELYEGCHGIWGGVSGLVANDSDKYLPFLDTYIRVYSKVTSGEGKDLHQLQQEREALTKSQEGKLPPTSSIDQEKKPITSQPNNFPDNKKQTQPKPKRKHKATPEKEKSKKTFPINETEPDYYYIMEEL